MATKELLQSYARDVLKNLFNPAYLQTHPLGDWVLSRDAPEHTRAQALRRVIVEEIEKLRPSPTIPFGQPEWLPYRILCMYHIEGQGIRDISKEIGIGRTSFYRYYQQARDSLVSLLWERHLRLERERARDAPQPASPRAPALEEAVRVAAMSRREWVDVGALLRDVCLLVEPLAVRANIAIALDVGALPRIYGESGILRQALVAILSEAIDLVMPPTLRVTAVTDGELCTLAIDALRISDAESALDERDGLALGKALLGAYGAQLWMTPQDIGSSLRLAFRGDKPKTILIIDDDQDTTALYSRYLGSTEYDVRAWNREGGLARALDEANPDLVLLDMLMPEPDGWRVLQEIRARPQWEALPIIVCSVLHRPGLALAMGAARVLQKPVAQDELLIAVQQTLQDHPRIT